MASWLLNKNQGQVSVQAKEWRSPPVPLSGGQQLMQKVTIHLWQDANDAVFGREELRPTLQVILC